ncbi:MAG: hypothetical protein SF051_06770 [Elusimicrobiota bacterium]|nr:hypothetical protein [Elusimicrobiota bacterium]
MKAFLLLAALMTTAGSASAVAPAAPAAPEDKLLQQIHTMTLTYPNGGITAAVKVKGAKQGINLELTAPAEIPTLAPVEGLAERPAPKRRARRAERPAEQAEVLETQGEKAAWENTRK